MDAETRKNESTVNLTVGELENILKQIDNKDMEVIIPVIDVKDTNYIDGFRYVRTAGILTNRYEPNPTLCLNASADGLDISSQLKYNGSETVCEKVMF